VLEEKDLTVEGLKDAMVRLMDKKVLTGMLDHVKDIEHKDATDILIGAIMGGRSSVQG
jgi:hypothetical protein